MTGHPETLTLDELRARARSAGLVLTEAQLAEIQGGYLFIAEMARRVRRSDGRPREAEPAHIFRPRFED